jgi:hypothetical protein
MRCSTMKNTMPAAPPLDARKLRSFAASLAAGLGIDPL